MTIAKTVIITGGSQGVGAGLVKAFLDPDYNIVATSGNVTRSTDLPSSSKLALIDGDMGTPVLPQALPKQQSGHSDRSMRW